MYLESKETKGILPPLAELQVLKVKVAKALNATSKEVDDLFSKLVNAMESSGFSEPYKWDFYESCFYVGSLLTTIGYGHITPSTIRGRAFSIIYSLVGIPLTLLVIRDLSNIITNCVHKTTIKLLIFFDRHGNSSDNRNSNSGASDHVMLRKLSRNITSPLLSNYATSVKVLSIIVLFLLVVIFLLVSALMRVYAEGWTFFEGFYFWYITLTTIGFGDYVPYDGKKPPSDFLVVIYYFGTFYLLLGLSLVASLIQCIVVLLQGRLPSVKPSRSSGTTRFRSSISRNFCRHCASATLPTLMPRRISFAEEDFTRLTVDNKIPRSNPPPTVNLCITAAVCGGALNGLLFQPCQSTHSSLGLSEKAIEKASAKAVCSHEPEESESANSSGFAVDGGANPAYTLSQIHSESIRDSFHRGFDQNINCAEN
eukprot:gene10624-19364_t